MPSIAVLPFNMYTSKPENQFLGDSVAEEIINSLSDIEGLNVIARSSSFAFKNTATDLASIGQQYNIDCFLEGSISILGTKARVSVRLIDSQSSNLFLKNSFEVEVADILNLHDTICLKAAEYLRENFGHFLIYDEKLKKAIPSLAVYSTYVKGKSSQNQWTEQGLREAIAHYDLCIEQDPAFVRPYYGKVQSYGLLAAWGYMNKEEGFGKAVEAFAIAQDLDKSLPDYYLSLIGRSFWQEWNFPLAFQQLTESLKEHPNFTNSLEAMGELLIYNGYFKEAEQYLTQLVKVDPVSPNHHFSLATCYYLQENYEKCTAALKKSLQISIHFMPALILEAFCRILQHKFKLNEESPIDSRQYHRLTYLDQLYHNKPINAAIGDHDLDTVLDHDIDEHYPTSLYLTVFSGDLEKAFRQLTSLVENKQGQVLAMRYDPFLKPLRAKYDVESLHELWLTDYVVTNTKPQNQKPFIDEDEKEDIKILINDIIDNEREYLNPQLTLRDLAEKVSVHPNKISFVINNEYGKNFNEFLNSYRLAHFQNLVKEGKASNFSIIGLAYDSGFNSKSVFNNFFKKQMGVSPKVWLRSQRGAEL